MISLKLQHLTLFLSFCSPVLMVLWPVSQTQARGWWSGGLTSTSGPARRSSRYETLHLHLLRDSLDSLYRGVNCLHAVDHFAFRGSCRGSLTRPPLKTRTPVWTWTSLYTCRSWKRCCAYSSFIYWILVRHVDQHCSGWCIVWFKSRMH